MLIHPWDGAISETCCASQLPQYAYQRETATWTRSRCATQWSPWWVLNTAAIRIE